MRELQLQVSRKAPVASRRMLDLGTIARLPLPRNPRRFDDVAGVVRGFRFKATDCESSTGVDVAAKAAKRAKYRLKSRWAPGGEGERAP
jgi:hypothetical protein